MRSNLNEIEQLIGIWEDEHKLEMLDNMHKISEVFKIFTEGTWLPPIYMSVVLHYSLNKNKIQVKTP